MATTVKEYTAAISLALIMAFRMLGLFMILPVFSIEGYGFAHANAQLIGIALGIYGFTQACLQMPFGILSDRIGRKPIITLGLILFAVGSVICALSTNIYVLIIGRACQGGGAIGSTILALLTDLTRDQNRSKAMAIIGLSIGCSFSLAMVLGPLINGMFHLVGIFWFTAGLACFSILLLYFIVPSAPLFSPTMGQRSDTTNFLSILKNPQLMRLNFGIFTSHAVLTALFIAIPVLLAQILHVSQLTQAWFYLCILLLSFLMMTPLIIIAEKTPYKKLIFTSAILLLALSQPTLLFIHSTPFAIGLILLIFFTAFTLLEALLPSWVSKISPTKNKGMAMGIYSSFQFLGIFVGGLAGGWCYNHFSLTGILLFNSLLLMIWLIMSWQLKPPPTSTQALSERSLGTSWDSHELSNP